ncbi:hypothetical protein AGMMS50268_01070 [Spirochaetia bacterium]|nr:hypothetical protein AGMMS50268_01070 [Spirochaetia bacterium]
MADPALSARLLDITPDRLLQGAGVEPLGSPEKTITGAELRHLHWLENQFTEYYVIKMVVNSGPNAYIRKNIENPC